MLGADIKALALKQGIAVFGTHSGSLDITNEAQVTACMHKHATVDVVINCAAYTNVDSCESQQTLAFDVNANGPRFIAEACQKQGLSLVHFSTDYVFDGSKDSPYTESDPPNPLSVYGQSKLNGEHAIQAACHRYYIFRVQWLYGQHGHHFINTMKRLFDTKEKISVVNDQFGTPTWTRFIAEQVLLFLKGDHPFGLYHLVPEGSCHWAYYAQFLADFFKSDTLIQAIPTIQYPLPATRPFNGRLSSCKFKACFSKKSLPHWETLVTDYLKPG